MCRARRARSKALSKASPPGTCAVPAGVSGSPNPIPINRLPTATLYTALVTLSKLLAPAMPFLAEEMYRNLVCSVDPKAPESVHLADWPKADESQIDETLNREMALVMKMVSLGHNARQKANRKVRQPLAEAGLCPEPPG